MNDTTEAQKLKALGNDFFSNGKYSEAIDCYSKAIELDKLNAILYCNRAFAHLKLQNFLNAENDCNTAIRLDSTLAKAYFRRGLARKSLNRYKLSLKDFQKALSLAPNNKEIKEAMNSLNKFLEVNQNVEIFPIEKVDEFKSKVPLHEMPIKYEMPVDNEKNEIQFTQNLENLSLNYEPRNFGDFELIWREIKDVNLKVHYLNNLNLDAFHRIFKYPVEASIIFDIFNILLHSSKYLHTYNILVAITKNPRFDCVLWFISNPVKEVLKNLFTKLLDSNEVTKTDLEALAKQYNL